VQNLAGSQSNNEEVAREENTNNQPALAACGRQGGEKEEQKLPMHSGTKY